MTGLGSGCSGYGCPGGPARGARPRPPGSKWGYGIGGSACLAAQDGHDPHPAGRDQQVDQATDPVVLGVVQALIALHSCAGSPVAQRAYGCCS